MSVLDYFTLSADKQHYICNIIVNGAPCNSKQTAKTGKEYLGRHAPTRTNTLKRHLQRKHVEIYEAIEEKGKKIDKTKHQLSGIEPQTSHQVSLLKYFEPQRVTISMTSDIFRKSIIDMVVKNGISFKFFSSDAFRTLNGELAGKFGISLDRNHIRAMVINEARTQKEQVKHTLQGKYFFLKMDACTRQRTNYFAINIQFISDEHEIVIKTLSVRDTKQQHSSDFIRHHVEEVLREYGITKDQILVIVTDNASNMVKAVDKLNEKEAEETEEIECHTDDKDENVETDDMDHVVEMGISGITGVEGFLPLKHMRCAAHTLQLAIRDGLKGKHAATVIARIKKIVNAARAPKIDSVLKRRVGKGALIDQDTRWGSTYVMIERLLQLRPILEDMANPGVTMTEYEWNEVAQLESLLKLPYLVTKRLQDVALTPGVFLKEWKNLIFKLGQIGGILADSFRQSMEKREVVLMDNDVLLAAIYIDPQYRILLNEEQIQTAKHALCELTVCMRQLEEAPRDRSASDTQVSSTHSDLDVGDADFEKQLDLKEKAKRRRIHPTSSSESGEISEITQFRMEFTRALTQVEKINRESKLTVHEAIPKYPEIIQAVAWVVTALPSTQVSVERLFSGLRFIKSDFRASLKEDVTDAILFLRTNSS